MVTLDEEFVASVEPLQKPETGNTVELAIATAVATPTREHQIPHGIYALETDGFQLNEGRSGRCRAEGSLKAGTRRNSKNNGLSDTHLRPFALR